MKYPLPLPVKIFTGLPNMHKVYNIRVPVVFIKLTPLISEMKTLAEETGV